MVVPSPPCFEPFPHIHHRNVLHFTPPPPESPAQSMSHASIWTAASTTATPSGSWRNCSRSSPLLRSGLGVICIIFKLHFGSKNTCKISIIRGFIDKFSLFLNLSEALIIFHLEFCYCWSHHSNWLLLFTLASPILRHTEFKILTELFFFSVHKSPRRLWNSWSLVRFLVPWLSGIGGGGVWKQQQFS